MAKNIENKLKDYLFNTEKSIQEVLFVPNTPQHPLWDDNLKVLQLANQQILQPLGAFPKEHIYAFIGVHARTKIIGKRDSIGFLVSNFRVLAQTDCSVIGTAKNAQVYLFTKTQKPEKVFAEIWNDFMVKNQLMIEEEQLLSLNTALNAVVKIVLPELQKENYLPSEIEKSLNIDGRINEMGLQGELKSYIEDEKKYKTFSKKYKISDILFGSLDKPLFGGLYGFVITKTGLTSRDLMEDIVTSAWQEIKENPAKINIEKSTIIAGQKKHVVPSHQSHVVPTIIILINEIANGEIMI
ncbi:MAG: hypothetical protein AAF575_01470 [Bacteroidota bacterium]